MNYNHAILTWRILIILFGIDYDTPDKYLTLREQSDLRIQKFNYLFKSPNFPLDPFVPHVSQQETKKPLSH